MAASNPRGVYDGSILCPGTRLVIVAVIRAGILPAQTCFEEACRVIPTKNVRLDFLNMSRTVDEDGKVTGVRFDGSKVGGAALGVSGMAQAPSSPSSGLHTSDGQRLKVSPAE